MAFVNKTGSLSDDEDDLNQLRMAALQSLKPKSNNEPVKFVENVPLRPAHPYKQHSSFGAAQTTRHHHNRGYRHTMGRMSGRNGINSRIRTNSNLISIQVIEQDHIKEPVIEKVALEPPKLVLPQDRYHKPHLNESPGFTNEIKEHSGGNKFDRYEDNSDDSESDSDELSGAIIVRTVENIDGEKEDNVDDLLGELDSVINKLERKDEDNEIVDDVNISDKEDKLLSDEVDDEIFKDPSDTLIITEFDADPEIEDLPPEDDDTAIIPRNNRSPTPTPSPRIIKKKSRSPSPYCKRSPRNRSRTPPRKRYPPPLAINTEVLNTISMAPLSPRSAAFVLENRQILARRQINSRSPRRSRTRSRSRSLSPIRRRSRSPRSPRSYQNRRNSLSPRRRSKSPRFSPKRRSNSPRNYQRRYTRRSNSPGGQKPSVHKRLGGPLNNKNEELPLRRKRSRSTSLSLSPSPDRAYPKRPLNESTGYINNDPKRAKDRSYNKSPTRTDGRLEAKDTKFDPILEARKKKFESPVVLNKNSGIIKLKNHKNDDNDTKSPSVLHDSLDAQEDSEEEGDNINSSEYDDLMDTAEDEQDQILDLNPALDDLWSDEESDAENEGRFKSRTGRQNTVKTISIRNLTNKPLPDTQPNLVRNRRSDSNKRVSKSLDRRHKSRRSRTPSIKTTDNTLAARTYSTVFSDKQSKTEEVNHERRKKVKAEITEVKKEGVLKTLQENKSAKRKVKIHKEKEAKKVLESKKDVSKSALPEVMDKEDDGGGDLRTELSRRRAQRLTKLSSEPVGNHQARLLKNALHEVVSAAVMSAAGNLNSADRKVLILKRLASNSSSEPDLNAKATSEGKLPIHMRLGTPSDVLTNEVPIRERRTKRSRSGKRKSRQAVQV